MLERAPPPTLRATSPSGGGNRRTATQPWIEAEGEEKNGYSCLLSAVCCLLLAFRHGQYVTRT